MEAALSLRLGFGLARVRGEVWLPSMPSLSLSLSLDSCSVAQLEVKGEPE